MAPAQLSNTDRDQFLLQFVECSGEGMAMADLDGRLLFVNTAWARMHGYEQTEELLRSMGYTQ